MIRWSGARHYCIHLFWCIPQQFYKPYVIYDRSISHQQQQGKEWAKAYLSAANCTLANLSASEICYFPKIVLLLVYILLVFWYRRQSCIYYALNCNCITTSFILLPKTACNNLCLDYLVRFVFWPQWPQPRLCIIFLFSDYTHLCVDGKLCSCLAPSQTSA